jgi:GxxExxY protein
MKKPDSRKAQITQINEEKIFPFKELTYKIIGVAMKVHKQLGPGFLEAVYEEALIMEFTNSNISFENQVPPDIYYEGKKLKRNYRVDFIINGNILIEIKKIGRLTKIDEVQMINYLGAASLKIGLLVNFGRTSLQWKRIIY